jgi:hypothetical protein
MPALIAFIVEAGWSILSWLLKSVVIKFVIGTAMYFIIHEVMNVVLANVLPSGSTLTGNLNTTLGSLGSDVWYFLDYFNVPSGISLVLGAYTTRFILKFIPKL